MVRLEEITNLMDEMMKLEIFSLSERTRMVKDEKEEGFLDPNLIMNARHKRSREKHTISSSNARCSAAEIGRLLRQEEVDESCLKKEQELLDKELKRFEWELQRGRPKFSERQTCSRRRFASSDDDDFWRVSRKTRDKMQEKRGDSREQDGATHQAKTSELAPQEHASCFKSEGKGIVAITKGEIPHFGRIKITLKEKSDSESNKQDMHISKICFEALRQNAKEKRRLREIRMRIQRNVVLRLMRKYFDLWRRSIEIAKKTRQNKENEREIPDEKKIELFINAITEKQKRLMKERKLKPKNANSIVDCVRSAEMSKRDIYPRYIPVESPAQNRLNTQKRIIEKQKAKLAEQSKLIEELKLKQTQDEISRTSKETMNTAKDTLMFCGESTRRTLVQLMRQAGYRDKSLLEPLRVPSPPKFLLRMEARAEARKERKKLAESVRSKKLEEKKLQEATAKLEEEKKKKRLQQESRAVKQLREEQERLRLREIEKWKRLNAKADEFYRKYLLRQYIMRPFKLLIKMRDNRVRTAESHYNAKLKKSVFTAWRNHVEKQCDIRMHAARIFYNKILLKKYWDCWEAQVKDANAKYQVALDFYDMKLLEKYFRTWELRCIESKEEFEEKETLAQSHYDKKLKAKCFTALKKYPEIKPSIEQSERRRCELRQLVQRVIPDFDPVQRGVITED